MSHPAPENDNIIKTTTAEVEGVGGGQETSYGTVAPAPAASASAGSVTGIPGEDRGPATGHDAPEESSSKADAAKEQGQQVKDEAVQGGKHVAGVAAEQGQSVAGEATDQAKDLMAQAKSQLADQAATQQENLTSWLRSLADELHQMVDRGSPQSGGGDVSSASDSQSDGADAGGVATKAVSEAHGRVKEAADWLEKHEPGDLIDEATRFARRRPGAFLAVAALGGLLVGRFTRGLKDDSSVSSAPASDADRGAGAPAAPSSTDPSSGYPAVDRLDEQGFAASGAPVTPAPFGSGEPYEQGPR